MTSLAELGIEIKTDSVVKAIGDLDGLVDAGKGAEGAAKQVESSWAKAMAGLRGDTGQIVKELQTLNASQTSLTQQMIAMGRAATDASSTFGAAAKAQGALATSTDSVAQAGQKMAETAEQQSARMAAMVKSSLEASDYHQRLTQAVNGTASAMDSAGASATDWAKYQQEINARGQALLATEERLATEVKQAATATDLQADGLAKLLGQINPAVAALDRLDEQQAKLSKYKAAGLLDNETFKDYSAQIDRTRQKLNGFDESLRKTEGATGQTKAALSQLPAQFTDIFTSLAGGQNPLMVLIQQGGQLKDSFGGIAPMFDALGEKLGSMFGFASAASAIGEAADAAGAGAKAAAEGAEAASESLGDMAEGANTAADASKNAAEAAGALRTATAGASLSIAGPIAALLVALGILSVAYKQGSDEITSYENALAMTGNTAGTSADQLSNIAKAVSAVNGTVHEAAASLAVLVGSTKIAVDQFQLIATAAANFEDATETAALKTVASFEDIAKEPVKAILKLNESMNFLTISTLEQIRALEKQGKTQEASALANQTYADALNRVADRVNANLGTFERGWKAVEGAAKGAWDAMLNIGRDSTFAEQITEIDERIQSLKDENENLGLLGFLGKPRQKYNDAEIERQEALKTQVLVGQEESKRRAEAKGAIAQTRADAVEAETAIRKIREETQTNAQKREKEIAEYRRNLEKIRKENPNSSLLEEKKIAQDIANINEKWADKKIAVTKAYAEPAGIRLLDQSKQQYAVLKEQAAMIGVQNDGTNKLGTAARDLIQWEQQIADIKGKKILTADQKSLLVYADQITAQKKSSAELEKQNTLRQDALDKEAQLLAFTENLKSQLSLAKEGLDGELAGAGMGDRARQRLREDLRIRQDYQRQMDRLTQGYNKLENPTAGQTSLYKKETQELRDALDKRMGMQQDYYAKEDADRGNWMLGVSDTWKNYLDVATDYNQQAADATSSILGDTTASISDSIQGLIKGTMSLGDAFINLGMTMGNAVLGALADIAAQWIVVQALKMAGITAEAGATVAAEAAKTTAKVTADTVTTASSLTATATTTTAQVAAAGTTLASWLPAALVASVGSFGAAAIVGGGALLAAFALIKGLGGFSEGGYTGTGGVTEPAGVVHKGEIVWSQADIRRFGGVAAVEALRNGNASSVRSDDRSINDDGSAADSAISDSRQRGGRRQAGNITLNQTNNFGSPDNRTANQVAAANTRKMRQASRLS